MLSKQVAASDPSLPYLLPMLLIPSKAMGSELNTLEPCQVNYKILSVNLMSQVVMPENCLMASSISTRPPPHLKLLNFNRVLLYSVVEPTVRTLSEGIMQALWLGKGRAGFGQGSFGLSFCIHEMLFPLTLSSALPSRKRMQTKVFNERKILCRQDEFSPLQTFYGTKTRTPTHTESECVLEKWLFYGQLLSSPSIV